MSNFWAKFYEPLPSAPLKPNNASAIFGGQAPYGLRAAEPSIFRPKDPTPNKQTKTRKKVARSHSDVGISKSSERRKSREIVVKRKEPPRNSENSSVKNNRPVSPRKDSEKSSSSGDSPDGESNGDRYPLFISVKKTSEAKPRKSTNGENHCNGTTARRGSESSPKSATKSPKVANESRSPFDSLRREKTDFIIRPRKSGETGSPTTALKREKSDITLKRSQSPSGIVKPRVTASPASIRREKSDITLKRSQPPAPLKREKSDLVRPRGSASPGPLRREKSDITGKRSQSPGAATSSAKPRASASPGRLRREKSDLTSSGSQSPSSITKEKSDVVKPRGSTSPGSLKREKSDLSKKPPPSPSKSGLSKPRAPAPGGNKPDNTPTTSKDSQSVSVKSDKKVKSAASNSEASGQDTKPETNALKGKEEATNHIISSKTVKSPEKSESVKKPPSSPSKSSLPKPRVFASAGLVKADTGDNSLKDSQESVTSSNSKATTCTSPEPQVKNTKVNSVSDAAKDQNELIKKPLSSNIVESPRQGNCNLSSPEFNSKPLGQEKSDIVLKAPSSGNNTEIIESRNCISAGVKTDQRSSSPDTAKDSGLNRTTSPVSESQTVSSEKNNSNIAEMSKIPTPTSSNQVSRIPSLTKTSTPPSKIPPKSKIPSFSKKSEEEPKTNIPTGISDKPTSKIPGPQRADPAKENKDPALNGDSLEDVNKQNTKVSRIPSIAKSTSPAVSKIPSMTRPENQGNQTTEGVETPKSRIPSISSSQQGNSTPPSKIPSFLNKHSLTKTPSKEEPESKIPHLSTTPKTTGIPKPEVTGQTGIPKLDLKPAFATTESRIPQLHSPGQKESGIPKPEVVSSGTSKPETPTTPSESKIPQFSTPRSKIPAPAGSILTRKDSDERIKKPKIEETPKVEETSKVEETMKVDEPQKKDTPSPGKVPPTPPPRQDVSTEESKANLDLSMNEDIFSEAKRMEELLRNESIVVEVPTNEDGLTIGKSEVSKLDCDKAANVEQKVTESVGVSESSNNNLKEIQTDKKDKEPFSFKTFGKKEDQVTVSNVSETVSATTFSLGLKKEFKEEGKTEEMRESIEVTSPMENKETPAIDTLGQYEQQSRRSRSRQRKIISPDGDEANKTFEQTNEDDEIKTALDKEFPSVADDTEAKTKQSKSKTKHDKPKFVIESSLGADFYQSKSSQSKDSIADEAKAKEVVVIQNKAFDDSKGVPKTDFKKSEKSETATNKDSAAFDDVDLSSNRESKVEMKAWSMEELDEKTVKCSCGRGGKCAIM